MPNPLKAGPNVSPAVAACVICMALGGVAGYGARYWNERGGAGTPSPAGGGAMGKMGGGGAMGKMGGGGFGGGGMGGMGKMGGMGGMGKMMGGGGKGGPTPLGMPMIGAPVAVPDNPFSEGQNKDRLDELVGLLKKKTGA